MGVQIRKKITEVKVLRLRRGTLPVFPDIAFDFNPPVCYAESVLERQIPMKEVWQMCNFDCAALLQMLCRLFGFGC